MATLEEVVVIPEFQHHHHRTESRSGQCLVVGAVTLALISGMWTGGLFGMMIEETIFHVKDLPTIKAKGGIRDLITISLITLGFYLVLMLTLIGIGLGYGAYSFLITIKGLQAKTTAIGAAAMAALFGITACGAAIGAAWVPVSTLGEPVHFLMTPIIFLSCCLHISACCESVECVYFFIGSLLIMYYIIPCSVLLMDLLGFSAMCINFSVLILMLYACVYSIFGESKPLFVPTVFPILLLLFTMLFFVVTETKTLSTAEKETVIIVLAPQLFEAALGHLVYRQVGGRGGEGAWKVCLSAVPSGGAVLVAIQKASFLLNTEASLGGLLGVSGAAGVALSAAGELGQRYGGKINQAWGGKLGRSAALVGAAAGAFLTGGTKDFSYGIFKAVCAAMILGMPIAEYILHVFYRGLQYLFTRIIMCVCKYGDH